MLRVNRCIHVLLCKHDSHTAIFSVIFTICNFSLISFLFADTHFIQQTFDKM